MFEWHQCIYGPSWVLVRRDPGPREMALAAPPCGRSQTRSQHLNAVCRWPELGEASGRGAGQRQCASRCNPSFAAAAFRERSPALGAGSTQARRPTHHRGTDDPTDGRRPLPRSLTARASAQTRHTKARPAPRSLACGANPSCPARGPGGASFHGDCAPSSSSRRVALLFFRPRSDARSENAGKRPRHACDACNHEMVP